MSRARGHRQYIGTWNLEAWLLQDYNSLMCHLVTYVSLYHYHHHCYFFIIIATATIASITNAITTVLLTSYLDKILIIFHVNKKKQNLFRIIFKCLIKHRKATNLVWDSSMLHMIITHNSPSSGSLVAGSLVLP